MQATTVGADPNGAIGRAACATCALLMLCALGACAAGGDERPSPAPRAQDPSPSMVPGDAPGAPWVPPVLDFPAPDAQVELRLSQLGLYADIGQKELAPDLIAYEPRYPLWSDGAEKRRWLRLPPGTQIDVSDPDHYQFPVGTVFFKEFARDGKRLETRVIARTGASPDETFMGTFLWQDDEQDALLVREGRPDVRGTDHDLPTQKNCRTCHNGEPGRVLGFSAVQAPEVDAALFSAPVVNYTVPGDADTARALGYLHANCGLCHNPNGSARNKTALDLRLSLTDVTPSATSIERATLGVLLDNFSATALRWRVAPGEPEQSALLERMRLRGEEGAMPPIGSEHSDPRGIEAVATWIAGLPRDTRAP
jgi:hypothetical protein